MDLTKLVTTQVQSLKVLRSGLKVILIIREILNFGHQFSVHLLKTYEP
jgi:hypothetical protein